jgi:hypothetical protein
MQQLQFTVSRMSLQQNQQSILVQVTCDNPVDYGGLTVIQVHISTYFEYSSGTLFQNNSLQQYLSINQPLAPNGLTTWVFGLPLNPTNASSIAHYKETYGTLTANVTLGVIVSSFLYLVTGAGTGYTEQQNVTLT